MRLCRAAQLRPCSYRRVTALIATRVSCREVTHIQKED